MNSEGPSFPETVERLAGLAGLQVPQDRSEDRERSQKRAGLIDVLEAARAWFAAQLGSAAGREERDSRAGRGPGPPTVKAFRVGLAPRTRGHIVTALRGRGLTVEQLIEAGQGNRGAGGGGA